MLVPEAEPADASRGPHRAARRGLSSIATASSTHARVVDGVPLPPRAPTSSRFCRAWRRPGELADAGLALVVVTNQPDIARGTRKHDGSRRLNGGFAGACRWTDVRVCPHDDGDGCDCRKPTPGMLLGGRARSASTSPQHHGRRSRDVEAGRRRRVPDGVRRRRLLGSPTARARPHRADPCVEASSRGSHGPVDRSQLIDAAPGRLAHPHAGVRSRHR